MIIKKLLRGLRGGLVFETTLPFRQEEEDFWAFVERSFLFPVIGALTGSVLGGIGLLLFNLPRFIAAGLFLVSLYLICGILHTDGLADFADGLVTGGTHSERLEVMKDEKTGAAGLVTILITNLLLFSGVIELFSLSQFYSIFFVILAAEILAKWTMLSLLFFGRSAHEGMGSTFMEKIDFGDWFMGTLIAIAGLVPFFNPLALVPLLAGLAVVYGMSRLGVRVIGGVNGDIVGAAGELVRPLVILSFVITYRIGMVPLVNFPGVL